MKTSLLAGDTNAAKECQLRMRTRVKIVPLAKPPALVAGADAAFSKDEVVAVCSLFRYPGLEHVEDAWFRGKARFPYIPGYLSFREGPALLAALERLSVRPDLLLVDGQGIAHPRRFGIACHLGVLLGIPVVGCAKTRLTGRYDEPARTRGSWTHLYEEDSSVEVGAVLRTRDDVKPLFVSPGHLIDIYGAVDVVMSCLSGFRIPEPLRRADILSKEMSRQG